MAKRARLSRQQAEARGRRAERFAALYLQTKLYTLLDERVRFPSGEIDLIARKGSTLAFIEVKQRQTIEQCQIAVSPQSWYRIAGAAATWAARQPTLSHLNWRYDLIAITPWSLPKHYKDFWRP